MLKFKDKANFIREICAKIRENKPVMTCKEQYDNLIRASAYEDVVELIEHHFGEGE